MWTINGRSTTVYEYNSIAYFIYKDASMQRTHCVGILSLTPIMLPMLLMLSPSAVNIAPALITDPCGQREITVLKVEAVEHHGCYRA